MDPHYTQARVEPECTVHFTINGDMLNTATLTVFQEVSVESCFDKARVPCFLTCISGGL